MRTLALVMVATATLAFARPLAAQEEVAQDAATPRLIDDARRLYAELEFDGAIDAAQRALAEPGITDLDRASALETMGCALVVLDREQAAREAFEALFRIDPYWPVREPSGSPRIRRFVETVRGRIVDDAAIDLDVIVHLDVPRAARIGRPIALEARVEANGEGDAGSLDVQVRGEGEVGWTRVEARREGGRFVIELPARSEPEELELYAEARDGRGRIVARAGGPLTPLRVPIRSGDEPRGSLLEEPWLWGVVGGVVVIGIAIGIGVAVAGPERASPGTLQPGRVELPLLRF